MPPKFAGSAEAGGDAKVYGAMRQKAAGFRIFRPLGIVTIQEHNPE